MQQTERDLIHAIKAAFGHRRLAATTPIFESHSVEVASETIEAMARQVPWTEFPEEVLSDNPLALAFMSPAAFATFLPAYMTVSISHYCETGTLTSSLVTALTPPDAEDARRFAELAAELEAEDPTSRDDLPLDCLVDEQLLQVFHERAAELTDTERDAVRAYLEFIERAHGEDFPIFGPQQALERFWGRSAAS